MLSYDGIQDVFTAILVIIVVSVVVALAWLSTNVREQPLVATAVVVFQSESTSENQTDSANVPNQSEIPGSSAREGEASAVVKESENSHVNGAPAMEVSERTEETSCQQENEEPEADGTDVSESTKPSVAANAEGENEAAATSTSPSTEQGDEIKSEQGDLNSFEDNATSRPGSSSTPSHLAQEELTESVPEMEVRYRRLKQFISMGEGSSDSENCCNTSSQSPVGDREPKPKNEPISKDSYCSNSVVVESSSPTKSEQDSTLEAEDNEETRPPGSIRIRLKFLDETQRFVFAQLTEQVGSFKRQHFSIEMDENRRIRLIFNGQLLSQDNSTLAQYGLFDNCVVHCHVSQPQQTSRNANQAEPAVQEEEDAYVSGLLAPLLYFVMGAMWCLRYEYGHLFNTMSTVILLFLTALLLFSTYLLYITQNVPESRSTRQVSAHSETETQSAL